MCECGAYVNCWPLPKHQISLSLSLSHGQTRLIGLDLLLRVSKYYNYVTFVQV